MSLSFELKDIADYMAKRNHPAYPDKMHPVLDKLIWGTMAVEIGTITAENAEEFYWRYAFARKLDGDADVAFNSGESFRITLDDVKEHIGLRTNVSTTKDRKKWLARFATERAFAIYGQTGTCRENFDRVALEKLAEATAKATA